jgi:hypothetical protein
MTPTPTATEIAASTASAVEAIILFRVACAIESVEVGLTLTRPMLCFIVVFSGKH